MILGELEENFPFCIGQTTYLLSSALAVHLGNLKSALFSNRAIGKMHREILNRLCGKLLALLPAVLKYRNGISVWSTDWEFSRSTRKSHYATCVASKVAFKKMRVEFCADFILSM